MIFGKHKKRIVGTTKLVDGDRSFEVLGKLNERYFGNNRKIEATRYGDRTQAENAITNYCRSSKFIEKVVKKYNFRFNIINLTDQFWYIRVMSRGNTLIA